MRAGGAILAWWSLDAAAQAADAWPAASPEWLNRDAAGGLSLLPLLGWWLLFAAWAATSDWVSRDSARYKVRPELWTACTIFPFAAICLLAWSIPWSAVGLLLMALAWLVPLFVYSRERNPKAPPSETILTGDHLRRAFRALLRRLGVKVAAAPVADAHLPFVKLLATAASSPEENQTWQQAAAAMPGFLAAQKLLQEAAAARATTVVIEAVPDGLRVAHEVDGIAGLARAVKTPAKGMGKSRQPEVWGDAPPLATAAGTAALAALRAIAGAEAAKLAGEKEAAFAIEVDGKKRSSRLSSRASKTGQQVVIAIDQPPFAPKKLEDLGMTAQAAGRVRDLIALEKGLFIVSSPPAHGCSTTFDTVLQTADRLVRDFVSIEDSGAPAKEVQNVKPVRYAGAAGETPSSALKQAMLEYPRAVVTRDIADKELARQLLDLADDQQLVIVSIRAADAIEAIQRMLAMGVPADQLARCLLGSLSQRLVRKLCAQCGDPMPTPPDLLQRLKRTAEELPQIKRASPHGGCRACFGRQYVGRTALFELATGPTLRQSIAAKVDPKTLRQAAAKDGFRGLGDEGLAFVAAGTSSLSEWQRIFAVKKEAGPPGVKR